MIPDRALLPAPPEWHVDWTGIDERHAWVRALRGCPQDPEKHPEGDVWIHTRMVCEEMAEHPGWRELPEAERWTLFAAALLHDVAKPETTRQGIDGRLTTAGHARRGAIRAREILWRAGAAPADRESVAALVRHHQRPFFALEGESPARGVHEISQTARCDHLALLAECDALGRTSPDRRRILDQVELFRELCLEEQCLDRPRAFPSDHSRFLYFRRPGRDPRYEAFDDTRCEVTVMSGLPGAGKDTWLRKHAPDLPVVSLDALREELGVDPEERQGAVVQAARERAREHLRRSRAFAWNATNLSRQLRDQVIGLLADYHARVRIVAVEVPAERLYEQNRAREERVPEAVIESLLGRWEAPDLTEAHRIEWAIS